MQREHRRMESLFYAVYITVHPFKGFWDIKRERKGTVRTAIIMYAALAVSFLFRRQFTAYLFNNYDTSHLNLLFEVVSVLAPYLLWSVSSWCITTLMDGEGSFSDIFKATGYALFPMISANICSTVLSLAFTQNEQTFYHTVLTLGTVWTYALLFLGMVITQQYTVKKSLLTAIVTILGMMIIVFLLIMVFFLVQQVVGFVQEIWSEFSMRLAE